MFALAKQQLCTCPCTFLSRRCMTSTWNFLILTRPLYGVGEHNTNVFSLLLNLVLLDSTSENFANVWHTKWNWIRSMKSEIVRIHFPEFFKSDVFGLLSLRDFATIATWRTTYYKLISLINLIYFIHLFLHLDPASLHRILLSGQEDEQIRPKEIVFPSYSCPAGVNFNSDITLYW